MPPAGPARALEEEAVPLVPVRAGVVELELPRAVVAAAPGPRSAPRAERHVLIEVDPTREEVEAEP